MAHNKAIRPVKWSPEAEGLFRALAQLGTVRHFDQAAQPLVEAGLAKVVERRLVLRKRGKEIAQTIRRRDRAKQLH
jgi:hypothetical protein